MPKPDFDNLDAAEWAPDPHRRKGDMLHTPSGEIYRIGEAACERMVRKAKVNLCAGGVKKAVTATRLAPAETTKSGG